MHRGEAFGLDADDVEIRANAARSHRDASDEPPAADRHDDGVDVGRLIKQLKAQRALAGDHGLVVERVHQGRAPLGGELLRDGKRRREGLPAQQHLGTEDAGLTHLGVRRVPGHDDGDRDIQPAAVIRQRLGVVARRHGDDAAFSLALVQEAQTVECAALLERGRELEVLELQQQFPARERRERPRRRQGGDRHMLGDAAPGGADGGEIDHHGSAGRSGLSFICLSP